MTDIPLGFDFHETERPPQTGNGTRFGGRWRLVGAGLSNVWRYGDLDLPAASGRLLLRGPNGTGKTTALEALWPYLLDLDAAKLAAGKARPTTLKLLMSEGAASKRRYGYAWLSFAPPAVANSADDAASVVTFGVRLQYSENTSPAVKVVPFTVPGRPIHDVPLYSNDHSAFELEEFISRVTLAGGQTFEDDHDAYLDHLAARVWQTNAAELRLLATRLREVRNPTLLGDVSPEAASTALRASLPGVAEQVLTATADALAESKATRDAFARDRDAAGVLAEFAAVWTGHVVEVVQTAHTEAFDAATIVGQRAADVERLKTATSKAHQSAKAASTEVERLDRSHRGLADAIRAIELSASYQAAGRLADLDATLAAQRGSASSELARLAAAAEDAVRRSRISRDALDEKREDLVTLTRAAAAAGAEPVAVDTLLSWTDRPRPSFQVAGVDVDPGPGISVRYDHDPIDGLAAAWRTLADRKAIRADAAQLAIKDHLSVAASGRTAEAATNAAKQAELDRDAEEERARKSANEAQTQARRTSDQVRSWAVEHPDLRGTSRARPVDQADLPDDVVDSAESWHLEDVDLLVEAEPTFFLASLDRWAREAGRIAERGAAGEEQHAMEATARAAMLRAESSEHRRRAAQLRSGELLDLPRPGWAGRPDDEDATLGAALEWVVDGTTGTERALLEVALAAAGVLGATLSSAGAATDHWQIDVTGEVLPDNLSAVLAAPAEHPHAVLARAVLDRIGLTDTAKEAGPGALAIGRDGTFRAGVLRGEPAAAVADVSEIPAAVHIGARQRRDAALAEADRLESEANQFDTDANVNDTQSRRHLARAAAVRTHASTFPSREALRQAEAGRVAAEVRANGHRLHAEQVATLAQVARQAYLDERAGWMDRTAAVGLPVDLEQLELTLSVGRVEAEALRGSAKALTGSIAVRVQRTLSQLFDEDQLNTRLAEQAGKSREAHRKAEQTATLILEVRTSVGDSEAAVARHGALTREQGDVGIGLDGARGAETETGKAAAASQAKLESAHDALIDAQPRHVATANHLRNLLDQSAVAEVVRGSEPLADGDDLLEQVESLLQGRRTYSRRFLGERYDNARAELAGIWILARGDDGPDLTELDTFVLTHSEREYTPAAAAARAADLAQAAQKALAVAEESALTDFVIGRLPSAIGAAWTRMHDWKVEVNRKMRSAEASSGVGVQVQVDLSSELSPAARTVYELSCKVNDADRTDAQRTAVGAALQALLAAADGATMLDQLTASVDIREWVDVHYLVTRPDKRGNRVNGRWNRRTGLSGGERRLVVLAPMLAAAAAAYDRLGPTGLRLVPLDEVPAEVDERGREGLARYIAELDLDLVCTSYLWDGSPGAWDGIDAHDLESAPDGTVVAFPMLVRGLLPLPGDGPETSGR